MTDAFGQVGPQSVTGSALLVLVAIIAALFLFSVAFSLYALLLRFDNQRRSRRWERLSARWQEPLLAALQGDDPAVQPTVDEEDRLRFVQFVLEYSRRVRGEERDRLRALVRPYLDDIVPRTRHRRPEVRTRAIQTLGSLGLPAYSKEVLDALDDPSPVVAMVAARYIARPEFPELVDPILEHFQRFEGWNRRFLASTLAAMGPKVSERLRAVLADEAEPAWKRAVLADALLMQLDPRAGDTAARVVERSEDRELLAAGLRLLAVVGRPEHAQVVRPRCAHADFLIRAEALDALAVLGAEGDLGLVGDAMGDPSPWVALHAARAVRALGGGPILAELADSDDPAAELAGQVLYEEDRA